MVLLGDAELIAKLQEKLKQIENEAEDYADFMGRIGGLWHQIQVYSSTNWNIQSEDTLKEFEVIQQQLKDLYNCQIEQFITDIFNQLEGELDAIDDPEKREMLIEVYENKDAFKDVFEKIVFHSGAYTHIYTSVSQVEENTEYNRSFINNCFDFLIEIGFGTKAQGRSRSKHIKIGGKNFAQITAD